jgi:hypothetical protein
MSIQGSTYPVGESTKNDQGWRTNRESREF